MSKSQRVRRISLPCFGVGIRLVFGADGRSRGGTIASDLHAGGRRPADRPYDAAVDGLEALLLADACAGVDVESPAYLEGIETAVEAITNRFT